MTSGNFHGRSFMTTLMVVADSPKQLRASDVDRVLCEACEISPGYLEAFEDWLLKQDISPTTRKEITEWSPI